VNPFKSYEVTAFLDWIARTYPHISSLKNLRGDEFLELAKSYELSKRGTINENRIRKWESTQYTIEHSSTFEDALVELRKYGTDD
jgi:hypothetical protein